MQKNKIVQVRCEECKKFFLTEKHWYGTAEICSDCAEERNLKEKCKRHGGRDGLDCYPCKLEGTLNGF